MNRNIIAILSTSYILLLCVALSFVSGCSRSHSIQMSKEGEISPCTGMAVNNSPDKFQFAIVSDLHGGGREGIFPDAVNKLNLMQPEFVMSVGDLIDGYIVDEQGINAQWDELDAMVAKLEMPFFYVPGNHDITNPTMAAVWNRRLGRSYYHFVYGDVLFLCLNTEDTKPSNISDAQVEYFRKALADNAGVRWTLLFMHKPLWAEKKLAGFDRIEDLLAGRDYTVFAGHYHNYCKFDRKDSKYFILSTTGGDSDLRGDIYGEFDHIVWVTMTDDGPVLANLMLDGIKDENVTTEDMTKLTRGVSHGGVIIPPITLTGENLTSASTKILLNNPVDVPLRYVVNIECDSEKVSISPQVIDQLVPAGETLSIPLKLAAFEAIDPEQVGTILMTWTATAMLTDRQEPVELPGRTTLWLERKYFCPPAPRAVKVDGLLDEWPSLPVSMDEVIGDDSYIKIWGGPQDSSASFATSYDDEYIYVAIRARDDVISVAAQYRYWEQDAIELWVDIRGESERNKSRPDSDNRKALGISPGFDSTNAPKGFLAASKVTATGYDTEFAIPLSYLKAKQGGNWESFRLNLVQFDRDNDAEDYIQLWWRPSWRDGSTFLGSGTFRRK